MDRKTIKRKSENIFRAKHTHALPGNEHLDGSWVEGYLSDKNYINSTELEGEFLIDEATVCKYTGMTDKDKTRIWENDIVEAWSEGLKAVGVVRQRIDGLWIMYPAWQGQKMWSLRPNSLGETAVKVIGNIFDNPELVEEAVWKAKDDCTEKEIILVNKVRCCKECEFYRGFGSAGRCKLNSAPAEEDKRPDWCPRVPIPKKKELSCDDWDYDAMAKAWNSCIDAVTGKKEEVYK